MTKMFGVFIIVALIQFSVSLNQSCKLFQEIQDYHSATDMKRDFAYQVVKKIFYAFNQWYFTVTYCEFTYFENRILKHIENYHNEYPVLLINGCPSLNSTKVKPRMTKHGKTAYLVTSKELTIEGSEIVLEILIRTGIFKPRSVVIFVINIPVSVDSYFYYSMEVHFKLLWSRSITNSVLVLWSDQLKVYTYNPFSEKIIDVTEVQDISKFLSQQYNNLHGYTLRLSVFRKVYVTNETGPIICSSRLAITTMNHLNATCQPIQPRDGNTVGDLLENGTATGVTSDLIDGFTDLELSSRILKNSFYGYIDTSCPLVQDELCFLIKKSTKQSTFTTTIKLIKVNILCIFIFNVVFLIVISLVIRLIEMKVWNIKEHRTSTATMVDLIKCFIRQTANIKFAGPVFRCTILMIMMYSLVIDCAIDGIITSAITYPRFKPDIDSIPELLATNLTFGVHNRDFLTFNSSLNAENYEKFKNRIEIVNDRRIKTIIDQRQYQYALLLRKTDSEYISRKQNNMKDGRPLYHTVQDCPVPCFIVYGLRYGSPYLIRLNYILNHLNQGGILHYWTQSDEYTLYQTHKRALYGGDNKGKIALTTENLKEVYLVWFIGVAIGIVAFIFEYITFFINKLWIL